MGVELQTPPPPSSLANSFLQLKFNDYKEVYHLKGNRIIDFKLISVDKVILLFLRHLTVIDTTSGE